MPLNSNKRRNYGIGSQPKKISEFSNLKEESRIIGASLVVE
jgi:hypothetical protein